MNKITDIQALAVEMNAAAQLAVEILKDYEGALRFYDQQKYLTEQQTKQQAKTALKVRAIKGLLGPACKMVRHFENNEAEAWASLARSGEGHVEYMEVIQQKLIDKCREVETLKKEVQEMQESLHRVIMDFAA